MSGLGTHAGFILAAYAMAALVFAGLSLRAWLDYRVQRATLARLEERGVRRRSAGPEGRT
ncbi:heme exporter protein CcmD [Alsobacter sp. SYSU M60028]|uniref:Heme exporter protein D n=1 Tax=Alsobacter ponti TaxID=2962936 RepID=A0ABT1LHU0_9HYPH|nr:heme exporter protein CcmD [Alsobacter ponti]MCP8940521.1 heme exporter protein CcmD [Alsobacter ponti]